MLGITGWLELTGVGVVGCTFGTAGFENAVIGVAGVVCGVEPDIGAAEITGFAGVDAGATFPNVGAGDTLSAPQLIGCGATAGVDVCVAPNGPVDPCFCSMLNDVESVGVEGMVIIIG